MTEKYMPPQTRAQFEELLRSAGFSNREAKRIAAEGFHPQSEAEGEQKAAIIRLLASIENATISSDGDARHARIATQEAGQQHTAAQAARNVQASEQEPAAERDTRTPGNHKPSVADKCGQGE